MRTINVGTLYAVIDNLPSSVDAYLARFCTEDKSVICAIDDGTCLDGELSLKCEASNVEVENQDAAWMVSKLRDFLAGRTDEGVNIEKPKPSTLVWAYAKHESNGTLKRVRYSMPNTTPCINAKRRWVDMVFWENVVEEFEDPMQDEQLGRWLENE
jgi:hypothetical protein